MKKIQNFKSNFNNYLIKKYNFDNDDIDYYWKEHRPKVEEYNRRKANFIIPAFTLTGVGIAGVIVGSINPFDILNIAGQIACIASSGLMCFGSACVGTTSICKNSPYEGKQAVLIDADRDYNKALKKYKKNKR